MVSPRAEADKLFQAAKRLVQTDRYASALLAINQAIGHFPAAYLYDYRGLILSLMGQVEEALASFGRALELAETKSQRAETYFHRGLLYGKEQFHDQAHLDLTRAYRLTPDPSYREALDQLRKERDE
jgi:tetratricopeptide (TPR) repeat protein